MPAGKCLVSKKKRRFKANGFNLDLSYFMTRTSPWASRQRVSSPTCWKRFDVPRGQPEGSLKRFN